MTRPIHRPFNRPTVPVRTRPITGRESIDAFLARGGSVETVLALQRPIDEPTVERWSDGIVADRVLAGDGNRRRRDHTI